MNNMFSALYDTLTASSSRGVVTNKSHDENGPNVMPMSAFRQGLQRCHTKHELDSFVHNYLKCAKYELSHPRMNDDDYIKLLLQCLSCYAFGYDISFSHVYCVQLAQRAEQPTQKHIAYSLCNILLNESSPMTIMMVRTLQRDLLKFSSVGDISWALVSAGNLLGKDLIPAVAGYVNSKITHSSSYVRRRAVLCLGDLHRKHNELISEISTTLHTALRDRDPRVMWAAVQLYVELARAKPTAYKDQLPAFLSILDQALNGKLPSGFMRNEVCAPHLLVKLLQAITLTSAHDDESRNKALNIFQRVFMRYSGMFNSLSAVSICSECCMAFITLEAQKSLVQTVIDYAGKLLSTSSVNYKFTGLKILLQIPPIHQSSLKNQQKAIISCLNVKDRTICHQTLKLVLKITTAASVDAVYRLFNECCKSVDKDWTDHVIDIITHCPPSESWFISHVCEVIAQSKHGITQANVHQIINFITTSYHGSATSIQHLADNIQSDNPDSFCILLLLRLVDEQASSHVPENLCNHTISLLSKQSTTIEEKLCALTALRALVFRGQLTIPSDIIKSLKALLKSDLVCLSFLDSLETVVIMKDYQSSSPVESNAHDAILDQYVELKLSQGARPCQIESDGRIGVTPSLSFTTQPDSSMKNSAHETSSPVRLNNVKHVWTEKGRVRPEEIPSSTTDEPATREEHDDVKSMLTSEIFSKMDN